MKTLKEVSAQPNDFILPIKPELDQVEETLLGEVRSAFGLASQVLEHTIAAGGKRIRPMILLHTARLFGSFGPRLISLATALEMIHTATLLHDDVIDETPLRRGRMSAWNQFGSKLSIITGDYLFARAFIRLTGDGDREILHEVSRLVERLCEGELVEHANIRNVAMTAETYLEIIQKKTAYFLEACAVVGGLLSGASEAELSALRGFGFNIGMAFQITDDILDYLGDPLELGKPIGSDLREGKITLPLIEYLKTVDSGRLSHIQTLVENGGEEAELKILLEQVRQSDAGRIARHCAVTFCDQAKQELERLPHKPERLAIERLTDYIIERTY